MTPNYNYDPSTVSSTIEVFPAGRYEFKVLSGKSFVKTEGDTIQNYGVRYTIEVADGEKKGKKTVMTCFMHSEGAAGFSKQFQMACLGYKNNQAEEQRFNSDHNNDDWNYNPDEGTIGEGWKQLVGTRIIGNLEITKNNKTGDPMQQFKGWEPIS